jgi:hypothetical protein
MKGVLLFAFNTEEVNYYEMAVKTAKRVNYFLDLPVSVVTDDSEKKADYKFDKTFIVKPDKSNVKNKHVWINKGRHQAYDITPYYETILLDTDYLINSNTLSSLTEMYEDYICPNNTHFLMENNSSQEYLSSTSFPILWATLISFKKTLASKQLFECMGMIQENYLHYLNLYNIMTSLYRNDYALTIAHRILNYHMNNKQNYIPWSLVHVTHEIEISKKSEKEFNTSYTMIKNNNGKNQYIEVNNMDFHCMNKKTYMDIA